MGCFVIRLSCLGLYILFIALVVMECVLDEGNGKEIGDGCGKSRRTKEYWMDLDLGQLVEESFGPTLEEHKELILGENGGDIQ